MKLFEDAVQQGMVQVTKLKLEGGAEYIGETVNMKPHGLGTLMYSRNPPDAQGRIEYAGAFFAGVFFTGVLFAAAFFAAAFFAGAFLTAAFLTGAFFGGVATGVPFDGGPSVSPARADRWGVRVRIGTPDRIRTGVTTLKATRDSCEPVFECSRSSGGPGLFVLERESNASERTNTPGRTVGLEKAVLLCP